MRPSGVCDHGNADCIGVGFGGTDVTTPGFDAAIDASEQVDFVGDLQARIEAGR